MGVISGATPAALDFSLDNSGGIMALPGGSGSNVITATLISGTTQSITLSGNVPSQIAFAVAVSFNPSYGNPTFTSVCTITVSSSAPAGAYEIIVIGTGGGVTRSTTFMLTIVSPCQKGDCRIVLDASPKHGLVNQPVTIFGVMYGSWRCVRDGVVVGKPVEIVTSWGFRTTVYTGSYSQEHQGRFSVITNCPPAGGMYSITATFYEDEDLQGGSQTISLQVVEYIETTLSLSSTPIQSGAGMATKFYGYLKEKDSGTPVAGKTVLVTILGGGSAWTYTVQTDNNGYYEQIYTNNNGIFTWAEARFNGEGMHLPSYSGRLYPR
jgi:hypothetical protein